MFLQINLQQLFSFSPSINAEKNQVQLDNYNWDLYDLAGKEINFKQSKGSVIVINFWATWCPPCIAEMPSLQNLYSQFKDEVDFYFISDEEEQRLNIFLKSNNYTFPVYNSKSDPPKLIASSSLPTTFILSKDGKIVVDKIGAAAWDSDEIVRLLTTLTSE